MKKFTSYLTALVFVFFAGSGILLSKEARGGQVGVFKDIFAAPLAEGEAAFVYLGYSAVIVRTAKSAVIIDPDELLFEEDMDAFRGQKVDAVLYTHAHGDHYSAATAAALAKATGAVFCAEGEVVRALKKDGAIPGERIVEMSAGRSRTAGAWTVTAVRGSHLGPILLYHLAQGGISVFHGGDSAHVPLKKLAAGLAFLPAGEPSPTASPDEALKMARDLNPRVVVAIHGSDAQYRELTEKIKAALPGTEVIVPETLKLYTIKLRAT